MISEGLMEKLSVTGLCDDSRRVKPGNLFFSIPDLCRLPSCTGRGIISGRSLHIFSPAGTDAPPAFLE